MCEPAKAHPLSEKKESTKCRAEILNLSRSVSYVSSADFALERIDSSANDILYVYGTGGKFENYLF